jgi:hypothetical protein
MKKQEPAWLARLANANDDTGFECSGFAANAMADEYHSMRDEIKRLRELVSRCNIECNTLDHFPGEYHEHGGPCPVMEKFKDILG